MDTYIPLMPAMGCLIPYNFSGHFTIGYKYTGYIACVGFSLLIIYILNKFNYVTYAVHFCLCIDYNRLVSE